MRNLSLMLFFLAITGCGVKTHIDSNKAPDFSEKITKLYILIKQSDNAKPFIYPFVTNFEAQLTAKGIAYQEYYLDPLSLETEEDVQKRIRDYGPNTVMIITQDQSRITHSSNNNNSFGAGFNNGSFGNGGFGMGYGSTGRSRKITGGTFDIKLFSPNIKNPVWRASLKADAPSGIKKAVKQANEIFINKLITDNLLVGPLVNQDK